MFHPFLTFNTVNFVVALLALNQFFFCMKKGTLIIKELLWEPRQSTMKEGANKRVQIKDSSSAGVSLFLDMLLGLGFGV